jgi:membrane protein
VWQVSSRLTTKQQILSIWRLGGLSLKELAIRVWQGILDHDLFGRASELAYNFVLAIFPLLIFLVSIFGLFASRGSELRSHLMFYLARVLPPSAYDLVSHVIANVAKNSGTGKLTLGIVLSLWFASGGTNSMISTLNGAYGVHDDRSYLRVRAVAIVLTIVLAILTISALVVVLLGNYIAGIIAAHFHLGSIVVSLWEVAQWPAAVFFVIFSFSIIYYYGPDLKEQHWYWITPGSIFGVLLWLIASFGFRYYLKYFNHYSQTYGSLGAVIILLVWFYVTGLAFLVGGIINASIEHAAAEHGHPEAKPEGAKEAA